MRWKSALHGNQAAGIESNISAISICTIKKPAAADNGSESTRLGAGGANHASPSCHPRALSAQSDTLGPLLDYNGLFMVYIEMVAAVESFISRLNAWSPLSLNVCTRENQSCKYLGDSGVPFFCFFRNFKAALMGSVFKASIQISSFHSFVCVV